MRGRGLYQPYRSSFASPVHLARSLRDDGSLASTMRATYSIPTRYQVRVESLSAHADECLSHNLHPLQLRLHCMRLSSQRVTWCDWRCCTPWRISNVRMFSQLGHMSHRLIKCP
eukprot:4886174-Pleurochrysis_carterae.AAC.1